MLYICYIYNIFIYIFSVCYHSVEVDTKTRAQMIFPFFFFRKIEIGQSNMSIKQYPICHVLRIYAPTILEARCRKITNERKQEFLSPLGRMQALLISYTAYNSGQDTSNYIFES